MPDHLKVRYVDRHSREENIRCYPEIEAAAIVETDIVTNGETLDGVPAESQDFVIANHMIEHCINPLGTLERFLEVLKPEGYLFISLPDRRYTFDFRREVTPFEAVLSDYRENRREEPLATYEEWVRNVERDKDPQEMFARQENIHFHAWDQADILQLFTRAKRDLGWPIEIEAACRNGIEVVLLLRKTTPEVWDRNDPETRGENG